MPLPERNIRQGQLQAGVFVQVGEPNRRAVFRQVSRRGTEDRVHAADALRHQRRIRQLPCHHHRNVEPFVDQIGHALREHEIDQDLGEPLAVSRDERRQMMLAKTGGRMNPQLAGRLGAGPGRLGLRQIDLRQNLFAVLQIAFAGFGERQMPRCSVQQSCMQPRLQIGDRA
jgi:hypothetical protein